MANVNITTILEVSGHGTITLGKHGATSDSIQVPKVVTVTGSLVEKKGALSAGAAATLYDVGAGDVPATWLKFFYWCDVASQLQLLDEATPTDVILDVAAEDPVVLSLGKMLADTGAATEITNGAASTVVINKIICASAVIANYHSIIIL